MFSFYEGGESGRRCVERRFSFLGGKGGGKSVPSSFKQENGGDSDKK